VGTYISKVETPMSAAMDLQALETKSRTWYSQLPDYLRYSSESLLWHSRLDTAPAFVFVHVLYNSSLALLHYSLVLTYAPLCAGSATGSLSLLMTFAVNHANTISEIIADLLKPTWHVSKCDGFWAYAAYIATSIQFSYLWSRSPEIAAAAKINIGRNLTFLKEVAVYSAIAHELVPP
jgi:hypothetical protein